MDNLIYSAVLTQQRLIKIKEINPCVFLCKQYDGEKIVILKFTNKSEIIIYEKVLPLIIDKYKKYFIRLELPRLKRTDGQNWIITDYYKGKGYYSIWHECNKEKEGGKKFGLDLSKEMAEILADFSQIDVDNVRQILINENLPNFEFDFDEWVTLFVSRSLELQRAGLYTASNITRAQDVFNQGFSRKHKIFALGDFYPRNLIRSNEKILTIDWVCSDDYRINYIDYLENLVAFAYIHMWGNTKWQSDFLKTVHKFYPINPTDLQKAILIKSFDQSYFWKKNTNLFNTQKNIFDMALSNIY